MPFPLKIQPIDLNALPEKRVPAYFEPLNPVVVKSGFKRLFDRQFSIVLKISAQDKPPNADEPPNYCNKDESEEFEPSSVCLAKMVQNFIEENNNEKPKSGRNPCICFNLNCLDGCDDEHGSSSPMDACDILNILVPSACDSERNLLADTARIVEKNKFSKRKDGFCGKILTDSLTELGYNASICKSKWAKTPSFPAGEYEYVDVITESERLLIDIDFRSEFEIARSTKAYKLVLQMLPNIFVGKSDRLEKIIDIVSESAKQSLNKKGMPFPPWRKSDYVKSKWLSPYTRHNKKGEEGLVKKISSCDEFEFILGEKCSADEKINCSENEKEGASRMVLQWEPPEIKPKILHKGRKIVAGLASMIQDKS